MLDMYLNEQYPHVLKKCIGQDIRKNDQLVMINTVEQASTKQAYQVVSLVTVGVLLLVFTPLSFHALAGALFSLYILNSLLIGFGEGIPINLVIVFLACLQWVIGPILSYYTGINHPFYGMQVPEEEYLSFAISGVVLYHLGLSLPVMGVHTIPKQIVDNIGETINSKTRGAYYLIAIGFISSFISPFAPPSLSFFLYLLSQLKYIGCFYLYVSDAQSKVVLYIVFSLLLLDAVAAALFHDLLLWGLFFLFIYCIKNKVSLLRKVAFLFVGFFMVFLLQSIKYQYRSIAWTNTSLDAFSQSELFFGMLVERLFSPDILFDPKANELTITRLNQGWIITRVMNYVPSYEPYAEGESVQNALNAALLPRFLSENKAVAGGRGMMVRFTGIELQEGTSMNVSLLGEGYGNYGKNGGVIFMFLIGIVFSLILRFIIIRSIANPAYLFWIPFLYLQVVKAETDLTTTLNYLVKASIVMFIVFYTFRKILKVEI